MLGKFDIEKTLIMALVLGLASLVVLYLDSKNNNYDVDTMSYIKIFTLVFFTSYVSANLTNGGITNSDLQVFTGAPDF